MLNKFTIIFLFSLNQKSINIYFKKFIESSYKLVLLECIWRKADLEILLKNPGINLSVWALKKSLEASMSCSD